jgi:predicted TIM-barrel fold metal-dependent hydrolase
MGTVAAAQRDLYLIDAHSQVDETVDLEKVISLMDQGNIRYVILTTVGKLRQADLIRFSRQHPDRIIASVRTKLPGYIENDSSFVEAIQRQVRSGNFSAMSELLMYHAKKSRGEKEEKAPEIVVHPDDKRVQAALRYAVEQGWPFVVHIEFASRTITDRKQFMEQLEAMLDAHPNHPFAMAHMGQLSAADVRRLIKVHRNIYFQTSRSDPMTRKDSDQPWINMFTGAVLAPEWRELVIEYPDRFVLAFDNVWPENWSGDYVNEAQYWRKALSELPNDVAQKIAHGNAEHLWKIPAR